MAQKQTPKTSWVQEAAVRVTRVHFLYIAAYMASIVVFDSWNLLVHDAVSTRWTAAGSLLILNTVLWYLARMKFSNDLVYKIIILTLIVADIIFASFNVFWQRGLASKAVALFAVPIITAAVLRSRTTILAAASLSVASYSIAAVRYYNQHYGESFRVELYGEVGFYCALFFILVGLLLIIIKPKNRF
jgi:hypothetical protein